jgi:phytoene/squalene synthetase
MLFDINNNGFSTLDEFLEYSEGASVAPASIFVHLCCLQEEHNEYKPADFDIIEVARPCAIFSYLVHIIRDFQEDQLNNLNYFATDILEKHSLIPTDLKEIAKIDHVPDSFRNVISDYCEYAKKYEALTIKELKKMSGILNGQYLLSLHIIYQLYKMVFDRIDILNGNFSSSELNPTNSEIQDRVLEVVSNWQQY